MHIIYFGKKAKEDITGLIKKTVNEDFQDDWMEKAAGNTCMAVMIVNENGETSHDGGYLQASYIHGIKCLQDRLPIVNVNERLQKTQQEFRERYPVNQDAESLETLSSRTLTWAQLQNEIEVLNALDIDGLRCDDRIYIKTTKVPRLAKADPSFLNSFYLDDLNALIKGENRGAGLNHFLSSKIEKKQRINILEDQDAFFNLLNPALIPTGKWPSKPDFGLYTAQMAATNAAFLQMKNSSGIMGVNGPPGTGKTTMLLDIISDIVVERAKILLKEKTGVLFGKSERIDRKDSYAYYFLPSSDVFQDIGIVVASNNNAAVENISKELPDEKKIDRASFPNADYFSEFSQDIIDGTSWGLLSAPLGNARNKLAFKNNVWSSFTDDKTRLQKFLLEIYNNREKSDRTPRYLEEFRKAQAELKALLSSYESFKQEADQYFQTLQQEIKNRKPKRELMEKAREISALLITLNTKKEAELLNAARINGIADSARQNALLYQSTKPVFFFLQKLFNTKKYRDWVAMFSRYLDETSALTGSQLESAALIKSITIEIEQANHNSEKLNRELTKLKNVSDSCAKLKRQLTEKYGFAKDNLPDENLFDCFETDKDRFHKANPWSSRKLNMLRSNIFIKSLKLHELAVLGNAKAFKNNLSLFFEMLDGRAEVSPALAEGLWQSFFFCVPVVSTSLAAVGKLFAPLTKERIAWLLIDEAGQATPQSAAGLINRAKRSIIVGDPLQIEPVITIPPAVEKILNSTYQLEREWAPTQTSVQKLADRITGLGTTMPGGEEEDIWTGLPLRAHRRCDNPMFDLANAIAYSGQMVKVQDDAVFQSPLGDSCWFNVEGTTIEDRQVVTQELEVLVDKVSRFNTKEADIFVISPFKSVASACEKVLKDRMPEVKCGTIHTFQGKEADIVFLVLGTAPDRPASRQWAAQKPNMLNVALTRAKRRFYVIGNKALWSQNSYFDTLASFSDHAKSSV